MAKNSKKKKKEVKDTRTVAEKMLLDQSNPINLREVLGVSQEQRDRWDDLLKSSDDKKVNKKAIFDEIDEYSKEGQGLYTYREIKKGLTEMLLNSKEVASRKGVNERELRNKIKQALSQIDNHILDARDEMYNTALELLKDEEGFKNLERLQIEYHKAIESNALIAAASEMKALESNKVNLLENPGD